MSFHVCGVESNAQEVHCSSCDLLYIENEAEVVTSVVEVPAIEFGICMRRQNCEKGVKIVEYDRPSEFGDEDSMPAFGEEIEKKRSHLTRVASGPMNKSASIASSMAVDSRARNSSGISSFTALSRGNERSWMRRQPPSLLETRLNGEEIERKIGCLLF